VADSPDSGLHPADRLSQAAHAAAAAGLTALLLTPGPDLRYLSGYDAHQLERLTCLVLPAAAPGITAAAGTARSVRPACSSRGTRACTRSIASPAGLTWR
jgi:Xaa-Pro aminopeptidase